METATSLAIGQLSDYLRGLTQRLDPGTGWYGEFLRRDPEGLRACLDGAAMPPWDVVESLLGDLAEARGDDFAAREARYAAGLRAAAVTAWDRLPGGAEELRTLYAAAAEQRAVSEAAAHALTARLAATADRTEADALTTELAWTRDDAARAAARHHDLTSRLNALRSRAPEHTPARQDGPTAQPAGRPASPWPEHSPLVQPGDGAAEAAGPVGSGSLPGGGNGGSLPGVPRQREAGEDRAEPPVGPAEGRRLRAARRAGGARYAGAGTPAAFTPPPGHSDGPATPPRGARFAQPEVPLGRARFTPPRPDGQSAPEGRPAPPEPDVPDVPDVQDVGGARIAPPEPDGQARGGIAEFVRELAGLRAEGRSGEAHVLLCEAAAWPPERLPGLAEELLRAGLGADWATLLWEAASLPPERLAAAAAALGEAGRRADCEALLRQGAARPAAEIADAALALAGVGRTREADALLGAFVKVRTAEEAVRLARRDPQWFTPRLLRAAEALSTTHHRDLVHALRIAKPSAS
ncbi:hypothetical protein [Streptomyces sp. NBC_00272]|uniref:hypothetical protein n=1 Tax=Streptomyces sp. NBC_00272 TaxID=2975698 RepID=UPI002E2A346D|nr:hypothetical protein [Streptomyces sp. NBC_00272]